MAIPRAQQISVIAGSILYAGGGVSRIGGDYDLKIP
jgi:hypothetical protein